MNKQNIHLITYGNALYNRSKIRIKNEALKTKWFDSINLYGPNKLTPQFKETFKDILNKKRGAGYWIWKLDIIKQKLSEINENDILIYIDAGCTINKNGYKRFNEYINLLNKSEYGIISFQLKSYEKKYTTKEIFNYFNLKSDSNIINTKQYAGGILIIKKNDHIKKILEVYEETLLDNPLLITDYYNNKNQDKEFKDNRHDQSIFSVIRKIYGSIVIPDETYFKNFNSVKARNYPFLATRRK